MERKQRNQLLYLLLIVFLILGILLSPNTGKQDIKDNNARTIAKVYDFSSLRKGKTTGYFKYYYQGNEYVNIQSGIPRYYLNRYFVIEFSTKNPENSHLFVGYEVTDPKAIQEAGFQVN